MPTLAKRRQAAALQKGQRRDRLHEAAVNYRPAARASHKTMAA
jgi:hypothetical protein